MNYNLHTHTYHCHHATGTPEEYVRYAIENGIREMGFADHFPWEYENGTYNSARIPVKEVPEYLREILKLKEKYKDQIRIHLGFEMEYYSSLFPKMKKKAIEYGADYLIMGEHFVLPEDTPEGDRHVSIATDDEDYLALYADTVIEGMHSGAFTYVAHPDVIKFIGDSAFYEKQARRICEASLKLSIPLEINFLGIRDKRNYPDLRFFKICAEVGAPVTFGCDAHSVDSAFDKDSLFVADKMVRELGLNYIGMAKIRPIN